MDNSKTARLNASFRDVRSRVDTLAKSVFLIAGGAVTLSINLYLNKKDVLSCISAYLKISWVSFLISMGLFSIVLGLLIIQGYKCGEFYREKIRNCDKSDAEPSRWLDRVALYVGIVGFIAFLVGMIFMIVAAFKV